MTDLVYDCYCSRICLPNGTWDRCVCPCPPGSSEPCQCGDDDWAGIKVCDANRDWQECRCNDTCGNGVLDPGEACDAIRLGSGSCSSFGYPGGRLACSPICTYDFTGCDPRSDCGDGQVEVFYPYSSIWEPCEPGTDFQNDCASLGFLDGELSCAPNCTLDMSGCRMEMRCGDGIRDPEAGEACDASDLGGAACTHLGFAGGMLGCDPLTCQFDTSGCLPE